MRRRDALKLILTATATTILARRASAASTPEIIPLWHDAAPGGGGPGGASEATRKGGVFNVETPFMEVFRPEQSNESAVLVAAGGGYKHIENEMEAYPAAEWLVERGITAFVLTYRLPGENWVSGPAAPLQDAQRAIRLIRSDVSIAKDRVSLLGFSAGGHLMGLAAAWSDFAAYRAVDAADTHSHQPDSAALVYPVITLEAPYDDTNTRRQMVGDHPTSAMNAEWSVQTHVHRGMPPTFLAQAEDDPISDPQNTRIMAAACERVGTPVDMRRYTTGGHGFGMGRPGTASIAWPEAYEGWLRRRRMII